MAASAHLISSAAWLGSGGWRATPMDAPIAAWPLLNSQGICRAAKTRSQTRSGVPSWASVSSSTTNSSPPQRDTTSDSRTACTRRPATTRSTSSPAAWPNSSLTRLKPSRSKNSRATGSWVRCARASEAPRRSIMAPRLSRPVSGSCRAILRNCSVACTRTDTSSTRDMMEVTWPSTPVNAELNHSQCTTDAPSACSWLDSMRLRVSCPAWRRAKASWRASWFGPMPSASSKVCPATACGSRPSILVIWDEQRVMFRRASSSSTVSGLLSMWEDRRSLAARSASVERLSSSTTRDAVTTPITSPAALRQGRMETVRQMPLSSCMRPKRS